MILVVRKAVKILMNQEEHQEFVASMEILKKELEPAEWKELIELTIFGIARTVTLGDIIELAKE